MGLDIGGTNTRIALHHSNDDTHPEENVITYKFKAPNTRVILAELERVAVQLAELGLKEVHGACLAGAGRVYDDGAGVRTVICHQQSVTPSSGRGYKLSKGR